MGAKIIHVPLAVGRLEAWEILNDTLTPWPGVRSISRLGSDLELGTGSQHEIDASVIGRMQTEVIEYDADECMRQDILRTGRFRGATVEVVAIGQNRSSMLSIQLVGLPRLLLCGINSGRLGGLTTFFNVERERRQLGVAV